MNDTPTIKPKPFGTEFSDLMATAHFREGEWSSPEIGPVQNISLQSALRLMFRDIGLMYCIEDEVLQITTTIEAQDKSNVRVYMVADLAVPSEKVGSCRGKR